MAPVTRAAFDIGSGATKLMVAEVENGKVTKETGGQTVGRSFCFCCFFVSFLGSSCGCCFLCFLITNNDFCVSCFFAFFAKA